MDEAKHREIGQWLVKAQHDLGSARCLMTGDAPYLDTAVYHCQQAAEKALKAFLALHDIPFPKTHDLVLLSDFCQTKDPTFQSLAEFAEMLTPYATLFRYPGECMMPASSDAHEALHAAGQVLDFVMEKMPPEIRVNLRMP